MASRGVRADRAPDRADRLLERARAARRHRAADGPLPRDPPANGRDAARLRLARRDRSHVLSRRRPGRDRRGRPLDDPLEGLARGALDAARRRAPRDRLSGRRLRPLGDHERRAVPQHACSRRARVRRRAHRERRDRRGALALRAAADLARPAPGSRGPRDRCRRVARGRRRARSQLVEHVHQAVRDRASQLTRTGSSSSGRTSAGDGGPRPGTAGKRTRSSAPAPAPSTSRTSATGSRASTRRSSPTACPSSS